MFPYKWYMDPPVNVYKYHKAFAYIIYFLAWLMTTNRLDYKEVANYRKQAWLFKFEWLDASANQNIGEDMCLILPIHLKPMQEILQRLQCILYLELQIRIIVGQVCVFCEVVNRTHCGRINRQAVLKATWYNTLNRMRSYTVQ